MIVSNEFQAILRRLLLFTTIFRPSKKFDGEKKFSATCAQFFLLSDFKCDLDIVRSDYRLASVQLLFSYTFGNNIFLIGK